jgi:tRNA-Thr(GGU) m(6)t(6)A37 methyltransferase TsaA
MHFADNVKMHASAYVMLYPSITIKEAGIMKEMKLLAIGKVEPTEDGFAIRLTDKYKDALTGLDGFSHLHVLWWADQVDSPENREITVVDKPYKQGPDKLGIYATRSPLRPNPIADTVIYVTRIDHEKGVVYTPYIDAEPGTPVLDIKIYLPSCDIVKDFSVPEWAERFPASLEESAEFDWGSVFNFAS